MVMGFFCANKNSNNNNNNNRDNKKKQNLYNWYRTGFLNDSKSEPWLWYTFKSAQVICFQLFFLPLPNGGKGSFTYVWAFSKTYTYT